MFFNITPQKKHSVLYRANFQFNNYIKKFIDYNDGTRYSKKI